MNPNASELYISRSRQSQLFSIPHHISTWNALIVPLPKQLHRYQNIDTPTPPLFTTVFWWSTHSSAPYTGLAILCTELRIYQIFMEIPAKFYKLDNCGPPGSASCSLIQLDKKLTSNYHPLCLKGIMCRAPTESIDISENLRPQTSSPHEWYI